MAGTLNVRDALIVVEDPIKCLLRWCDVVSFGAKADDRGPDLTQIDADAIARDDLRCREFVAYEQVIDHVLQLFAAQQNEVAPPFLELEVSVLLLLRIHPDVVLLAQKVLEGLPASKFAISQAPSKIPLPRSLVRRASQLPPSMPPR